MVTVQSVNNNQQLQTAAVTGIQSGHSCRFLKTYLKENNLGMFLVIILGIASSITSFLLTLIIGDFFMLQFNTGSSKGKLLSWMGIQLASVPDFFRLFVALLLIKFISGFLDNYLAARQGERFVRQIRQSLFTAQMMTPAEKFNDSTYGNYLLRYSNDLKAVQQYLVKGILGGIKQLLFTGMGLILLMQINALIGLICTGFISLIILLMYIISAGQRKYIRESRNRRSTLLAFVTRTFSRFTRLKSTNREQEMVDKFLHRSALLYKANLVNCRAESFLQSIAYLLQFGMIGCILWVMTGNTVHFRAADGLIVVLLLLLMQGSVRGLLKVPASLNKGNISLRKIDELVNNAA